MTENLTMLAPWYVLVNKYKALFGDDPEIDIEYDDDNSILTLYVNNSEKAQALSELLPYQVFEGKMITIRVKPANEDGWKANLFQTAFEGNPHYNRSVIVQTELLSNPICCVVFNPEVIQYQNDDAFDVNGVGSTLAQDLAEEIFDYQDGIFFNTERVKG